MSWRSFIGLAVAALLAALGCTQRYSQALTGVIPKAQGNLVKSSDTGFSFLGIAISEPRPAHEQVQVLLAPCTELVRVEVDYREVVVLIIGFPTIAVTGTCVKQ
jgi:hypothetical protein